MKRALVAAFCVLIFAGCGGSPGARLDEVEKKNADLTQRVQSLEQQLLDAQKQLIQQKQVMQVLNTRQREMEDYFSKLQVSQSQSR